MGVTRVNKATEATVTSTGKSPGTFPYVAQKCFVKQGGGQQLTSTLWIAHFLSCLAVAECGQT